MTEAVFARVVVFQHIPAMGEKFHGSFPELQDKLAPLGLDGDWIDLPHGVHKITTREKAGLLWSETKGPSGLMARRRQRAPSNAKSLLTSGADRRQRLIRARKYLSCMAATTIDAISLDSS